MSTISNDGQMRDVIDTLDETRQRLLAAQFVKNVLPLSKDERLQRVIQMAANPNNTEDERGQGGRTGSPCTLRCRWGME